MGIKFWVSPLWSRSHCYHGTSHRYVNYGFEFNNTLSVLIRHSGRKGKTRHYDEKEEELKKILSLNQ